MDDDIGCVIRSQVGDSHTERNRVRDHDIVRIGHFNDHEVGLWRRRRRQREQAAVVRWIGIGHAWRGNDVHAVAQEADGYRLCLEHQHFSREGRQAENSPLLVDEVETGIRPIGYANKVPTG